MNKLLIIAITLLVLFSCADKQAPKGKLFIIGGGPRPKPLVDRLIDESGLKKQGYAIILPMASEEPDSSVFYTMKMFKNFENRVGAINFTNATVSDPMLVDSVRRAALIYICGGDQNRFMAVVKNSPLYDAMHFAYQNGAVIAGTSAGAAVMSKKMITGNEKKYPVYTGEYRTIEPNNIEIGEGMGFVDNLIVDQHFVKRMRMNRLITVAIENPGTLCAGIDESTALLFQQNQVEVVGSSQVIALKANPKHIYSNDTLLAAKYMILDVYIPGMKFNINR